MPRSYMVQFADGTKYGPADETLLVQWAREGRIKAECQLISDDAAEPTMVASSHPALQAILRAPPTVAGPMLRPNDAPMSGLIPYRNPAALAGYYMGVFSLIPGLGLLLGPAALVCGVIGWRSYRREVRNKGAAHSWVAMILGALTSLLYWGILVVAIVASNRH